MSQAARDSTSGELSYQFVQDETYQSLGLLIIELVGFKGLLVVVTKVAITKVICNKDCYWEGIIVSVVAK